MAPGGKGETLWGVVRPSKGNVTRSKQNGLPGGVTRWGVRW